MRSHPIFPAFSLALGMFAAILAQLYEAFSPSVAVMIGAANTYPEHFSLTASNVSDM